MTDTDFQTAILNRLDEMHDDITAQRADIADLKSAVSTARGGLLALQWVGGVIVLIGGAIWQLRDYFWPPKH